MAFKFLAFSVAVAEPSFEEWAADYGFNGHDEMREAYEQNVMYIDMVNSQQSEFTLGVNHFSGWTEAEFQSMFTGEPDDDDADMPKEHIEVELDGGNLVTDVDWSTSGKVNPVKNQGSCGSCWAFGAVGVLESTFAISNGNLYNLAEQQLVDCDKSSSGCNGGLSRYSFSGYYKTHGACTTASYAYTAKGGTCRDSSCSVAIPSGVVVGYNEVTASASALKSQLVNGPLKVSVYAESTFQSYKNGIVSGGACKGSTNHAVMAVGYGSGFIKIRNSWGSSWGEGGHIRVSDTSSCSSGNFDMFVRTPIWPKFSSAVEV